MLITFPHSWPDTTVAALAMTTLALLDLGGAYAAKEAVLRRSLPFAVAGAVLFLLLFWVYASSLRYAELASVTLGWVVLLQVGVVLLDRLHYGTPVSRGQWAAVVVVLAAQAYLVMAPSAAASSDVPAPEGHPPVPAARLAADQFGADQLGVDQFGVDQLSVDQFGGDQSGADRGKDLPASRTGARTRVGWFGVTVSM